MNHHEFVGVGTVRLGSLLARDPKFFARADKSSALIDVADDSTTEVDNLTTDGGADVEVEAPIGILAMMGNPGSEITRGSIYLTMEGGLRLYSCF